jgi:hypothetical protein
MGLAGILSELDTEIAKLKQARALLTDGMKRGLGRPKTVEVAAVGTSSKRKPNKITPEGRKRIAEAVKRRWAAQKKAVGK